MKASSESCVNICEELPFNDSICICLMIVGVCLIFIIPFIVLYYFNNQLKARGIFTETWFISTFSTLLNLRSYTLILSTIFLTIFLELMSIEAKINQQIIIPQQLTRQQAMNNNDQIPLINNNDFNE